MYLRALYTSAYVSRSIVLSTMPYGMLDAGQPPTRCKPDESQTETDLRQALRGMKQAQSTARPLLRCADASRLRLRLGASLG